MKNILPLSTRFLACEPPRRSSMLLPGALANGAVVLRLGNFLSRKALRNKNDCAHGQHHDDSERRGLIQTSAFPLCPDPN